jgi:hypothetical protein
MLSPKGEGRGEREGDAERGSGRFHTDPKPASGSAVLSLRCVSILFDCGGSRLIGVQGSRFEVRSSLSSSTLFACPLAFVTMQLM